LGLVVLQVQSIIKQIKSKKNVWLDKVVALGTVDNADALIMGKLDVVMELQAQVADVIR
jgi:hypothetical protein